MGFSESIQVEALVASNRCCCICHKFCGTKIALHHIKQKAYGGDDSFDNCIPLCLDCHEDMGKADPKHSIGKHYSEKELRMHRDAWYRRCADNSLGMSGPICEDDIKLFERINRCFSGRTGENLRYEDLRWSHAEGSFRELFELEYDLLNPINEFVNVELEKLRGGLLDKIRTFNEIISMNTFTPDSATSKRQVTHLWLYSHKYIPVNEVSKEERKKLEAQYRREAEDIRDSAFALWKCYCEFLRQGRRIINR